MVRKRERERGESSEEKEREKERGARPETVSLGKRRREGDTGCQWVNMLTHPTLPVSAYKHTHTHTHANVYYGYNTHVMCDPFWTGQENGV